MYESKFLLTGDEAVDTLLQMARREFLKTLFAGVRLFAKRSDMSEEQQNYFCHTFCKDITALDEMSDRDPSIYWSFIEDFRLTSEQNKTEYSLSLGNLYSLASAAVDGRINVRLWELGRALNVDMCDEHTSVFRFLEDIGSGEYAFLKYDPVKEKDAAFLTAVFKLGEAMEIPLTEVAPFKELYFERIQ